MRFLSNRNFMQGALIGLLLCLSAPYVQTQDAENPTTVSYETAHNLAVTAFEVLSPLAMSHGKNNTPKYVANDLLDMALEVVRRIVTQEKMDRIIIPDFTETFKTGFKPINIGSSFEGKEGWVESLLSIKRRGDAVVYVDGTSLVLDAPIGLDTLQLGMKYELRVLGIKIKGGYVEGKARSNNVILSAAMDFETGKCELKVRTLMIKDLGKIDVKVSGYGDLDWIATQIGSWATNKAHGRIQEAVNNVLFEILKRELAKAECPAL